jgi:hypothetical protein
LNLQYVDVAIKYYYWVLEVFYANTQHTKRGNAGHRGGVFQDERHLKLLIIESLSELTATPSILLLSPKSANFLHALPGQYGRT